MGEDGGGAGGCGGEAGRFETVDAGAEAAADFGGALSVGDDDEFSAVGLGDDGRDLVLGPLVLVDEFAEVHAGGGEFSDLGAGVGGRFTAQRNAPVPG